MLLRIAGVSLSLVLIGLTAFAVSGRLLYPFELEWMEGATAVHVARLLSGEGIYVRPTLDFVPFGYPGLYYYLCLPVAWVIGPGLTALRVISVLATIATLGATYVIVRRGSGRVAGLMAAGLFAGTYPLSDGWFDLGRVDALYVALLACVCLVAVWSSGVKGWTLCGALGAAAFATKQPAVLAIAPLAVYLILADRRGGLAFAATFIVLAALPLLVLNVASDGWYGYYVAELPRLRMAVSPRDGRALSFWTGDLLPVWPALGCGFASLVMLKEWRPTVLAAGLVGAAWIARLEGGAWNNAVMPAYLAAAILLGVSLRPTLPWPSLRWSLAVGQLSLLLFDPRPFRPTTTDRARGTTFLQELRSLPKPVLVMNDGYWASAAALPQFAHLWR